MTKSFLSVLVLFVIVHVSITEPLEPGDSDLLKRSSGSICSSSFYDQIAMSVCASLPSPAGRKLIFPVRRRCPSKDTCDQICKSPVVIGQVYSWAKGSPHCMESLHLYKRPQLASNQGTSPNADVNRVGLITKRYDSCHVTGCGPNYCCCRKGH